MVKLQKDETKKNHCALMAAASASIRQNGVAATSIAEIAGKVGLTHGALYRRFPTKAALAAEVVTQDFDKIAALLAQFAEKGGLAGYVQTYLSPDHRDHFPWGCPAAPLAAEISRVDPEVQKAFCAGLARNLDRLAALIAGEDRGEVGAEARAEAMTALALMVGAMSLARATKAVDPRLSDDFLATARTQLLAQERG